MFKSSKVNYSVDRMSFDRETGKYDSTITGRQMEITIKAESEDEVFFLFDNLVEYMKEEVGFNIHISTCPNIEVYDNYVEYYDIISVDDKAEYDELKDLYKEWKKSAKTIVMPVEEIETIETESSEPTITESPVCESESVEVATSIIETSESITPKTYHNNNLTVRQYENYDNYEATGEYNVMDIIKNPHTNMINADMSTECKSYKTALKRFFKALNLADKAYNKHFEDWYESMLESCENGVFEEKSTYEGKYTYDHCYTIEQIDETLWYISLSVYMYNNDVIETKNSNATITDNTMSTPSYIIHTEPVNNPYAIGRLIRVDLYNNMTITDIPELQNYVLEQYQEGYTDSNGQRQVTYWRIIGTKNTDSTITELVTPCQSFEELKIDQIILYNNHNNHWAKAKIIDKTVDNSCICIETDIGIYNLTITDMHRIKMMT